MVRLPLNVVANDLNANPDLWQRVQANSSKALRKFDKLLLIAYDETWAAEALVAEANAYRVTLAKPAIYTLPERNERLLNDGTYRIVWAGAGYDVIRNSDNAAVSRGHANVPLAERALAQQHPRRMA